ncbi:MAG TPA: adenylate/guanylate cyclase domain-containing protein [Thauera sp.]|uniref:adenylate/guanylate cyclase domain-containing protein n=1 Tax=Thauera sp. TaxID=1905334 RepID=UPI002BC04B10|nr:adenylate/guanylate cyclase domain-containing protein [Thauera sp.]HRP22811.1 adenylate/guanylate cyclase domain-containing protein [Thauera sp.]HRP67215.1 adenylate/guanylate cyclase domain-containing protein [Thauera sp.]
MEQSVRTVVFADLTGSTGLFEKAGNVAATQIVTRCTHALGRHLATAGGRVVKYLGDGVLVLFDDTMAAVQAAARMQEVLEELASVELQRAPLGVKTGVDRGSIVEHDGDCYGDAVNVAARLSDRAQAGETLIGEAVFASLPEPMRIACHSLDRITIKGKAEPMRVWRVDFARSAETTLTTLLGYQELIDGPTLIQRIDIDRLDQHVELHADDGPLIIGRGEGAGFPIDDPRVSRRHARVEWAGGQCVITDFSSNGSWVRFAGSSAPVILRRDSCTLYGEGEIGLGATPDDFTAPTLGFRVIDEG